MTGERRRLRIACVTAMVVGLGGLRPARAQEGDDHDRALASFEAARRLIAANDCASALPLLADSIRREAFVGAHFSYAECVEATDPYAAFWHLREAAMLAFVKRDDRLAIAEQRAEAIALRTGGIRFSIRAADLAAPGFDLRLDGAPIDRFHVTTSIAAPPGDHTVTASTGDDRRFSRTVHVDQGAVTLTEVVLVRAPPPPSPPPAQPLTPPAPAARPAADEGPSGRRMLAASLGAAGISAVAVGAAFGVLTLERRGELDRVCNGDASACTGASSVVDPVLASAERSATASTVLLAVGGGLVAAAAYFWFTAPSASSRASRPFLLGLRW